MIYGKIIGGKLIQLSNKPYKDFHLVEEEVMPQTRNGYNLISEYRIINNAIHRIWIYEKITEVENNDTI